TKTFNYCVRRPRGYKAADRKHPDRRYPLVITLHRQVVNKRHDAFKGDQGLFMRQRGRQPMYEYWKENPARDEVILVAPTGVPLGYRFQRRVGEDLDEMWRSLWHAMHRFRVDWNRIFIEVEGPALRLACQQPFFFAAGFIVRGGEMEPLDFYLFENLNGVPLFYIGDEARWEKIQQPVAEALKKSYAAAGRAENLRIHRSRRDRQGALKGPLDEVAAFVRGTRRMRWPKKITWRFPDRNTVAPIPFEIGKYETEHDPKIAPEKTTGRMVLEAKTATYREGDEERPYTRIEVRITEAEELKLYLHDGFVPLEQPVSVVVNGQEVLKRQLIRRNLDYFMNEIVASRWFMVPFVAEITVSFPFKRQREPEEKPEEKPAEKKTAAEEEKKTATEKGK
ncbi:MAG: hypothetical protein ACE5JG_09915, partial [Planctomycetota bacterium]